MKFAFKVEGITELIDMAGTSQLDSFEWQNGRECAKITSHLSADDVISLDGGRIQSNGKLSLEMTTYFAFRTGMLIRREMSLEFPANISKDAGEAGSMGLPGNEGGSARARQPRPPSSGARHTETSSTPSSDAAAGNIRGFVRIGTVVTI